MDRLRLYSDIYMLNYIISDKADMSKFFLKKSRVSFSKENIRLFFIPAGNGTKPGFPFHGDNRLGRIVLTFRIKIFTINMMPGLKYIFHLHHQYITIKNQAGERHG